MDVALNLGIELGSSFNEAVENLELIKSLELSRKNLAVQSVKSSFDPSHLVVPVLDVDKIIHSEEEDNTMTDLENVMVLRKGRKIHHRKKSVKKKKTITLLRLGTYLSQGGAAF
jgi:hypothetical protein